MRVRYLLDTNIVSEPLRARPDSVLMRKLRRHEGEVAIGTPAWHELVYGCARLPASRRRQAIETYLLEVLEPSMPILPYSREAAEWHARERSRLEARGENTPTGLISRERRAKSDSWWKAAANPAPA